jgi:hypothetical protein
VIFRGTLHADLVQLGGNGHPVVEVQTLQQRDLSVALPAVVEHNLNALLPLWRQEREPLHVGESGDQHVKRRFASDDQSERNHADRQALEVGPE